MAMKQWYAPPIMAWSELNFTTEGAAMSRKSLG